MTGTDAAGKLPLELQILELFASIELLAIGPTDAEKFLGVSKGAISPRLKALAEAGYLTRIGVGKYTAGPKMLSLATTYMGLLARNIDEAMGVLSDRWLKAQEAFRQMATMFRSEGGEEAS